MMNDPKAVARATIVAHAFQPHYTLGFVNALAELGVAVDLIRSDDCSGVRLSSRVNLLRLGSRNRVVVKPLAKLNNFLVYHLRLMRYATRNSGSVVHVIGLLRHELSMGLFMGLVFRLVSKHYILTVHNLLPHDRHSAWKRMVYRLIYKIPHRLVVHTAWMKQELAADFRIPNTKIVVMQHGINDMVPDHGKSGEECRALLGIPRDGYRLLFFGRIAPYKGLETLLEALKELDERFFLVVAGEPYKSSYGNHIRQLIDNHPARNRILYRPGYVEDEDIATYFHASDVLVLPYKHIDQSGVVFLAYTLGTPVVAFDVGSMEDYVLDGGGVLVAGGTARDLAAGIEQMYRKKEVFTLECIRQLAQRYSWKNVLAPVIHIYL